MTDTQIVQVLVGFESELNIFEIEEVKRKGKIVKIIHVANSSKRVRCPVCGKYSRNVHSRLKSVIVKYLDIVGYTTYLKVSKRRFYCKECNKVFAENNYINETKSRILLKLKQKILMNLRIIIYL